MKKRHLLASTLAFACLYANAQFWTGLNPGFSQATTIAGISATDENTVWLAGRDTSQNVAGNRFARSLNGGNTWDTFAISGFSTYTPSNICAINKDTAWTAMFNSSGGGGIFRTNDGGANWTHQATASFAGGFPNVVHFFNANNGVALGDPNGGYFEIYTTSNGGNNWSRIAQSAIPIAKNQEWGTTNTYQAKGNTIYFLTSLGRLFYSANQGGSWGTASPVINGDSCSFYWVSPTTATHAIAAVYNSKGNYIVETKNNGQTWQEIKYVSGQIGYGNITTYLPLSASEGIHFIQGNSSVKYSSDNGKTWKALSIAVDNYLSYEYPYVFSSTANGYMWIGGRHLDGNTTGLIAYKKPQNDVMALATQISGGKTGCYGKDSVEIKIINSGKNPIDFTTNNASIAFEYFMRSSADQSWDGPYSIPVSNISTGILNAGQTLVKTVATAQFGSESYQYLFSSSIRLNNTSGATDWNDTSGQFFMEQGRMVRIKNVATDVYSNPVTVYQGEEMELTLSGDFSTTQWQSRKLNETTWTNEAGLGATTANYRFASPSESRYYRALTCNQNTDSILVMLNTSGNALGYTYFDNQTNASAANRVAIHNGKVHTAFTGSWDATQTTWADRGMFYNQFNGTKWDSIPKKRIESVRTGFGDMTVTKTGKEVVVAHDAVTGRLVVSRRNSAGTGAWTENTSALKGQWPRIICSGSDTIHIICLDTFLSSSTIRYYRSPNAGQTWDIQTNLPNYDVAGGFTSTNSETYAIDAYRNVVAIVAGGYNNKLVLWKSTDRGNTFTQKTIKTFPANFDGSFTIPYTETTDGCASVSIDGGGKVHVITSGMAIEDYQAGDNSWTWYWDTDKLLYWNDALATDSLKTIATTSAANEYNYGNSYYGTSPIHSYGIASMAKISANYANGNIFVVFAGQTYSSNEWHGINKHDIFGLMSPDGGTTWSQPTSFTQNITFGMDNINPSIGNDQSGNIHMVWISSPTVMRAQGAASGIRTMLHQKLPYSRFQSISQPNILSSSVNCSGDSIEIMFASFGSFAQINVQLSDAVGSFASPTLLATIANTNAEQTKKLRLPTNVVSGNNYQIRLVALDGTTSQPSTSFYLYKKPNQPVITNLRPLTFCMGDSTVLTIDTNQIGIGISAMGYEWNVNGNIIAGELKIIVKNTATVSMVVYNNCGIFYSDPVNVVQNSNQAITVALTPDTVVCAGSPVTLRANVLTGTPTSYQWKKNGVNTGTIADSITLSLGNATALKAGKYTIDITSVCGSYSSDTIDLTVSTPPTMVTQPVPIITCVGGNAVFKATSNSNSSVNYEWKKDGNTISLADSLVLNSVALSDTGYYKCIITNQCGSVESDSALLTMGDPVSITSTTLADTSVCRGSSLKFTVVATGSAPSYEWLRDGVVVGTNAQLALNNLQLADSGVYQVRVYSSCNSVTSTTSATVSVKDAATGSISRSGDSLILTISGTAMLIDWFRDGVSIGLNTPIIAGTASGNYHARLISSNGCVNNTAAFNFIKTGLQESDMLQRITVYPNPASQNIFISNLPTQTNCKLFDATGRVVLNKTLLNTEENLNVSHLSTGIYLLLLDNGTSTKTVKIHIVQ